MEPERIDELIALAALGELSDAERAELDELAHGDPSVRAELDGALAAAADVQSLAAGDPPVGLRASVLAAISEVAQETEESARPVDLAARRRRRLLPWALGAAAALVFLVGAFIVSNEASAPDQYEAIIEAPDAVSHSLSGDLGGTLNVTYSPSHSALVLVGDGIETLDETATYQLWADIDGHMVSVGVFRPDDEGHVQERLDGVDDTGTSINVTLEPAGGSEEPTLPLLAST